VAWWQVLEPLKAPQNELIFGADKIDQQVQAQFTHTNCILCEHLLYLWTNSLVDVTRLVVEGYCCCKVSESVVSGLSGDDGGALAEDNGADGEDDGAPDDADGFVWLMDDEDGQTPILHRRRRLRPATSSSDAGKVQITTAGLVTVDLFFYSITVFLEQQRFGSIQPVLKVEFPELLVEGQYIPNSCWIVQTALVGDIKGALA
jgi:hypothetical protein